MRDSFDRNIDYLRVSVTDRCNLRCVYCMPESGVPDIPHKDILRYEEIARIARILAEKGISRVKLTGGEPLVRRGISGLIRMLKETDGIEQVTLTTNGILLEKMLPELTAAGLNAVNISLDTANPQRYRAITRGGELDNVLSAIDACSQAGIRTKINCVPVTDEKDILKIASFARDREIHVRFIEKMPIGRIRSEVLPAPEHTHQAGDVTAGRRTNTAFEREAPAADISSAGDIRSAEDIISSAENIRSEADIRPEAGIRPGTAAEDGISPAAEGFREAQVKRVIERNFGLLVPCADRLGNGPARYYSVEGFKGRIGFISAMSHCFCSGCSRLRLTSAGFLKTCLYYGDGADLKPLLAGSDEEIGAAIDAAVSRKKEKHRFLEDSQPGSDKRDMFMIGG